MTYVDDTEDVHGLTLQQHPRLVYDMYQRPHHTHLVLMQTLLQLESAHIPSFNPSRTHLDLDIEHRMRVQRKAERRLDIAREPLLVALLGDRPLLLERGIVRELEQALELVQVLQEHGLGNLQRLLDEGAEAGVALRGGTWSERCVRGDASKVYLVQPATGCD